LAALRNVYACLVHERLDCVIDLVRNLRYLDPDSLVLLYNGGTDPTLLDAFPFHRHGAVIHPRPRPAQWGRLHGFALDSMAFALEHDPFDTMTIVDSDQLALRAGYTDTLAAFLADHPRAGLLGNSPVVQPPHTMVAPAIDAFREIELWRPFLQRFPGGEDQFVRWSFWPSTVFTADAARELTSLFSGDPQLREIMSRSQIWATEEIILPTLVAVAGFDVLANPCSDEFVKYRIAFSAAHAAVALERPEVFWMHPVPRRYDDGVRAYLRQRLGQYHVTSGSNRTVHAASRRLATTLPVLAAMRGIEGWLEEDEADLLLAAAGRALDDVDATAIVEVGSYCGRSPIVLGSAALNAQTAGRVFAVDPHDGFVGALDQGLQFAGPTFDRFQQNIALAGLTTVVEPVRQRSIDVHWDQPIALLFVDGLHDYVNVARDFYHFERWLAPGAFVAFHDYADYYPGVKTFVDELVAGGEFAFVESVRSLAVIRRTAETADTPAEMRIAPAIQAMPAPPPTVTAANAGRRTFPVVTTTGPLVSCIMPTADRAAFVPQAINYFLRQDYPNRELIVIDDGTEAVASLVPDDPRIRYVRLDERRTMGAKHNLACELARGEIICHWDDDDWNADRRVSYQVQELLRCPPMTLSGLSHVLFYQPATDQAWQYIYPPHERPWVGGNTLCYRKGFWDSHKFPDMNEGADTIFVWTLVGAHVQPLPDHSFFVAIIHDRNTSPKRTQGFGWHACPTEDVRALLKDDCRFYERLAVSRAT